MVVRFVTTYPFYYYGTLSFYEYNFFCLADVKNNEPDTL